MALLFKITYLDKIYRFTSGRDAYADYIPIPIKRGSYTYSGLAAKVTIDAPVDVEPFGIINLVDYMDPMEVIITNPISGAVEFSGIVKKATTSLSKGTVSLSCENRIANLDGDVPRRSYTRNCSFTFGDKYCTIDASAYKKEFVGNWVLDDETGKFIINGTTVLDPLSIYNPGYVSLSSGGQQGISSITISEDTTEVTLIRPFRSRGEITADTKLFVYPGCDKSLSTCLNYKNYQNFGGFPEIPDLNPVVDRFII